ncbi:hypothetical protein LOTGIDRAFT_228111 [Lottia gigantea]|uniref:Uncharacterized protein n=1 Tax=Lottia gigantea TaxID=225164 RepID=V4BI48_LOTGI|nr:hypothetical protein LOTGIDRAFT_228111 [Lottia gigantea]ESP05602.1 hypothetical protein LOTGIDRAFT_228111 [Lottia gigantea]
MAAWKRTLRHSKYLCPNVLKLMTRGKWVEQEVSAFMKLEMDVFLEKARGDFYLPGTLQRLDDHCGNVTFDWLTGNQRPLLWFRALCDPKGAKPCCYDNVCTSKSIEQCKCPGCLDMRQQINAEHANWTPEHPDCHPPERTPKDMCNILNGMTIYFVGDSFIRHLYTALLMLVKGNMYDGALRNKPIPQLTHTRCVGMYVFSDAECRAWINFNASLCNNTVHMQFDELPKVEHVMHVSTKMQELTRKPRSLFVFGIGIHNDYNISATTNNFLHPLLRHKDSKTWPRYLWHSAHAPGLLKTPRIPAQSIDSVLKYNHQIEHYLKQSNVPILQSFTLTKGVNSFDGAHYGLGVNLVKSQILIEYIRDLRSKENW